MRRAAVARFGGAFADELAELADMFRMHLARACNGLPGRRVELGVRRRLDERDAVGGGGLQAAPQPVEQRRPHQERGKVPVVEHQHLAQRLECAVEILQLPPDDGEIEPQPVCRCDHA